MRSLIYFIIFPLTILMCIDITVLEILYEYGLFENFEAAKGIFLKEQHIIKNVRSMRNNLHISCQGVKKGAYLNVI